ncbi:MAG: ComEC family competence protein [Oscillospiraceae bacterium]|nr:ComEC family competence protein [Oscillospiraceae bacterium]
MKRPALCIGFPYVLGLCLTSALSGQHRVWGLVGVLLTGLTVMTVRRGLWKYVLLSTLSCLMACCVYWHTDSAAAKLLTRSGEEQVFSGTVIKAAVYGNGSARYYLRGTFSDSTPARVEYFTRTAVFSYGDTLTLSGTPERISSGYLFDSAAYARANGIFLSYGNETAVTEFQTLASPTLRSRLYQWRERISLRIRTLMGDETGAMLTGMLFGDKSGMAHTNKTLLYRMGIGHILAVSGLHLDFLAMFAEFLLKRLHIGRKISAGVMAMLCILFVLLAGETISVRRACILILLRQLGHITFRKPDTLNSLSIAAFLLTLENPFAIHAAAFWLSFVAAWGIAVLAPFMTQNMKRDTVLRVTFADICSCCWCFAAVLPVCIFYFREISFLSPISNTFLIPLCMGAMLFGVLALPFGCDGAIAETFLSGADVLCEWILKISRTVTAVSWTHAPTGSRTLFFAIFAGIAAVTLFYLLTKSRRFTAIATAAVLLISGITVYAERTARKDDLRIAVLGSGKSKLLILTDGIKAVLLDLTGQKQLSAYAEAYLTENGISQVETLYLCKPSRQSMQQYGDVLTIFPPEAVCILKNKSGSTPKLFGTEPYCTPQTEALFCGAKLTVSAAETTLIYGGMTCCFTSGKEIEETADILYCYGKPPETLPDCGLLFVPTGTPCIPDAHTYIGADDLELTLTQSGICRVRRLYGEA